MMIERLESRRLLSVMLHESGTLSIEGTKGADVVRVTLEGKHVVVRGHASYRGRFASADVKRIDVQARGGNDVVRTEVKGSIWGGKGDDTLIGSAGDDYLQGDQGEDVLRGRGGNDFLVAYRGRDLLMGGAGADTLSGVDRRDVVRAGSGDDAVLWLTKEGTLKPAPEIDLDPPEMASVTPIVVPRLLIPRFEALVPRLPILVGGLGTIEVAVRT